MTRRDGHLSLKFDWQETNGGTARSFCEGVVVSGDAITPTGGEPTIETSLIQQQEAGSRFLVPLAGSRADEITAKPFARPAHPADPARGITGHQREGRDILRHHGAGADEAVLTQAVTADDRRIGADARTASNRCAAKLVLARDIRAGIVDVGEYATRAAEDVGAKLHAVIDRHVVLDLAAVANPDVRADHDVLPDRAVLADRGGRKDVAEVPDLRATAHPRAVVDIARFMDQHAGKTRVLAHLGHL